MCSLSACSDIKVIIDFATTFIVPHIGLPLLARHSKLSRHRILINYGLPIKFCVRVGSLVPICVHRRLVIRNDFGCIRRCIIDGLHLVPILLINSALLLWFNASAAARTTADQTKTKGDACNDQWKFEDVEANDFSIAHSHEQVCRNIICHLLRLLRLINEIIAAVRAGVRWSHGGLARAVRCLILLRHCAVACSVGDWSYWSYWGYWVYWSHWGYRVDHFWSWNWTLS